MLLIKEQFRLGVRSTEEMDIGGFSLIRVSLESSSVISEFETSRRPRHGGRLYPFVPMFMLYLLMECRKTTFRGIVRGLSDRECACLGLPHDGKGRFAVPSPSTLCHFANHVLPGISEKLGDELCKAVLGSAGDRTVTMDSTPAEASRYNTDADFNPHYCVKMDKAHILMCNGFPVKMIQTRGNAHDNPIAAELVFRMGDLGIRSARVLADGSYDAVATYIDVYIATGCVLRCNRRTGSVYSGTGEKEIAEAYSSLHRAEGYDPERKRDMDFMLRFLYHNGRMETAGEYLRDISMNLDGKEGPPKGRWVCECVHRAMKRWIDFSIFGLWEKHKESRMKCRFLCIQFLSMLFKGYDMKKPEPV
jgi:hypothetical protein